MDHTKMPMSEVLTPDEKLVADFIKTRTKKVLDDIQRLSKEQNADISEWAESFAYLARTYGRDSDETFKWFKYYFREGMIPANVALPLVVQVYLDSSVDGGFVNTFAKAFKQEPEDVRNQRIEDMKQELAEYELIPEDWGGSTIFVPVSAHTGEGIDTLLEMILLTAEVCELKANPNRSARGLVIEAQLDKGKGPVATILVQKGTLHVGDFIAAGACNGKVRAMMDDKGRRIKEAGPSTPVEILGLGDVPNAGEILLAFDSDKEAKNFAGAFVSENKNRLLEETKGKLSLDNLFDQIQASDLKELPLIVKADVQGSVEAVKQSLTKLSNEEVVVKVIHGGVGAINESDVSLAATSNAIIIGFNVRPDATAKQLAEQEGVDLRLYRVIYQAIEDVEAAMKGMLDPIFEEKVIGHAEVRQLFKASGIGTIAGSYILDGIFQRNCKVRISREGEQIFEGELASLKRFKDDVKEVKAGYECGLVFDGFNDVKEEDKVEAYIMVEVPR